ncbi:MAG TPA: hypothetical protein VGC54_10380 [Planctomycetota bacterium]
MAENEYFSFDKAIAKLSLDEEDLKRLISAGEIRAFRDGSKMRLRAEDVSRVAKDLGIGEQVGEEDAGEVLEVEEVLFSESADDEGMVTTQLSEEDTLLDDDLEVVDVADEASVAVVARAAARGGARAAAPAEAASPAITVLTIAGFALMLYAMAFVVSMSNAQPNGLTESIVNMFK